jgi:hypothetical protein
VVVWLKDTTVTANVTSASTTVRLVVDDLRVDNQLPIGLSEVAARRKDTGTPGRLAPPVLTASVHKWPSPSARSCACHSCVQVAPLPLRFQYCFCVFASLRDCLPRCSL